MRGALAPRDTGSTNEEGHLCRLVMLTPLALSSFSVVGPLRDVLLNITISVDH
jgi:hypothetical protein